MNIVKKKKIENVKVSAKNTEPFPKKKNTKSVNMHLKKTEAFSKNKKRKKHQYARET